MAHQLVSIFCLVRCSVCLAACLVALTACSASPNSPGENPGPAAASPLSQPSAPPSDPAGAPSGSSRTRADSSGAPTGPPDGDLLTAELNTVGWDQLSGSPVVLLRELGSGQVLPIWIGMAEARAISFELHGVELSRPMTHDLMTNLLATLGAHLEEVVVSDLRDGTYYGLLKLRVDGESEPRWVDTRPSDGLALALRSDATIRIAKKLIEDLPEVEFMAPESPDQVVRALGLTVVAPSAELKRELSLPDRPGLAVIATSGVAKKAGLTRGDLIVAIDGATPREPLDLLRAIENATGSTLSVTYWREGGEATVELSLDMPERPQSENVA